MLDHLPAPFQNVFKRWEARDIRVMQADWTTSKQRHVGAQVEYNGDLCYAKLALAKCGDLDEPDMLEGMRREVWWSRAIKRLRENDSSFPFRSPHARETNANQQPFQDEVAWIIMELIEGKPIVDWEPERFNRDLDSVEEERFHNLFNVVIASLLALEEIHPPTLERLGVPPLPSPPHGMRRWRKKGLLDMQTSVLGNGAFEIKNFWRTPDGQFVLMDNEFAGWYPRYDHLSYLYHRLYCNTMRPDLAKYLLSEYLLRTVYDQDGSFHIWKKFFESFRKLLMPRVLGGWYYDTVRRKFPPWHKKQQLRYGLYWNLLRKHYAKLVKA